MSRFEHLDEIPKTGNALENEIMWAKIIWPQINPEITEAEAEALGRENYERNRRNRKLTQEMEEHERMIISGRRAARRKRILSKYDYLVIMALVLVKVVIS